MTSEQIFHILGMRNAVKVLRAIDQEPMIYNQVVNKFQLNNGLAWRLLLLLKNAGLIEKDENTKIYYSSNFGKKMIEFSNEIDSPVKVSWDGGDLTELVF